MSQDSTLAAAIDDLIRRAEEHHDAKRYEEAYALYCEGLALDPENARLYAERGNELTWLNRREEALLDHDEAIRRDPTKAYYFDSRGRNFACMAAASDRDYTAALRDYDEAIRLDPTKEEYFTDRAKAIESTDPDAAYADYRQAIELGTDDDVAYFHVAKAAVEDREEWDTAIAVCTRGLAKWPGDAFLNYFYGSALKEVDRAEEAVEPLTIAMREKPDIGQISYVLANCLYELDRFAEAVEAYSATLALDASIANAWYLRGRCHWLLDNNSQAYEDLTEALKLQPDAAVARGVRGRVLLELERYAEALEDLEPAVAADPDDRDHRRWYAEALRGVGRNEEALANVFKLVQDEPDEAQGYDLLAGILRDLDEHEESLEAYEAFLKRGGNELSGLIGMGVCYTHLNENELAFETFQKVLEIDPGWDGGRFYCAFALAGMGEDVESRRLFDEYISADPNFWVGYFHRGYSYMGADDLELALADFTRAIEIAPDEAKLRWARLDLYGLLDDHQSAIADCDALVNINPNNAGAFWRRAEIFDALGQVENADADAARAEELEQNSQDDEPREDLKMEDKMKIWTALQEHFGSAALEAITLTERHFPVQVGADLQKALESLSEAGLEVVEFWAARICGNPVTNFPDAYIKNRRNPPLPGAPRYTEIDIGEDEPVRGLRDGLWVLKSQDAVMAMILDTSEYRTIRFQIAALTSAGPVASQVFQHLEDTVKRSPCYRGKILSLESREMYSGQNQGLRVHRLRTVPRESIILPASTFELLDRNVTRFIQHRKQLADMGLMAKKGLLFHGPPGVGKTHTIHFLAQVVPDQTTFLISANQVSILDEYMTLARLYQPSLIVIEDVDLIARQREDMRSANEEVLLNKLLNEMDGLQIDAQVMFILTTNRPEALEAALASRPGRIDQAIEFPLPDAEGRGKLARLYCGKFQFEDSVVQKAVARTSGMTASFMKELMRRAAQFALERGEHAHLNDHDVETAIDELLLRNGALNRKLLGFADSTSRFQD